MQWFLGILFKEESNPGIFADRYFIIACSTTSKNIERQNINAGDPRHIDACAASWTMLLTPHRRPHRQQHPPSGPPQIY